MLSRLARTSTRSLAGLSRTPALRFGLRAQLAAPASRSFLTFSPLRSEEEKKTQAAFRADDPEHPEQIAAREALAKGDTRHAYGLHKDAGAIGQAGIFEKYGVVPVIGLGLAALVSKEVLFLDEGLLLAGTFSTLIFAGYVNFGESVTKGFEADVAEQRAEYETAIDGVIESGEKALNTFKLGETLVDDTAELISAFNDAAAKHRATRDMALKQSVKEDIEFWMQTLADKERNFFDKLSLKLAQDSYEAVLEDLKQSDEAQQDAGIRNVLSRMNGSDDAGTEDVVLGLYRKHYNAFFEEFDKKKSTAKLTKDEIADAQADLERWAQMWQERTGHEVEVQTATSAKSVW